MLGSIGIGATTVAISSMAIPAAEAAATTDIRSVVDRSGKARTRLALLGTAGGPAWGGGGSRAGISTAVIFEDRVYIVDLGAGAVRRFSESGLPSTQLLGGALNNVSGIFFTHLHSDHTADWPLLYSTAGSNLFGRTRPEPIRVFGPGPRGTLPRLFPPNRPAPDVVAPDEPTPGIESLTKQLDSVFAQDFNDRARDSNFTVPSTLFDVNDIDLSGIWDIDPSGIPPLLDSPLQVWDDGEVVVTATLVDHHPMAPAFAYRFDTPDGSVVISGDTTISENLIRLASGADYLVHEAIDPEWVETIVATLPQAQQAPTRQHLLEAHTSVEQVGPEVAEVAGVGNLVLSHLVPADSPDHIWKRAARGFSGKLIVGSDLLVLPVGGRLKRES